MDGLEVFVLLFTIFVCIISIVCYFVVNKRYKGRFVFSFYFGATSFLWIPWFMVIVQFIWTLNINAANRVFPGDRILPIVPREIRQVHPLDEISVDVNVRDHTWTAEQQAIELRERLEKD